MVFKGHDKSEDSGYASKTSKFLTKGRTGNSQYTSTNSSIGMEYSKITEQDVQEEFLRLYTQLELLKEKNMRVGNRHLASKISAMQDAACKHDHDNDHDHEFIARKNCKLNNMICMVTDNIVCTTIVPEEDKETDESSSGKVKRQSVSFAQSVDANGDTGATRKSSVCVEEASVESTSVVDASIELSCRDEKTDSPSGNRNGRLIKSGHARTHAIVINLDDKSRFTEEVTV